MIGVGGPVEGTGVVGKGGGIKHDSESAGFGGIGVHGLGGSRPEPDKHSTIVAVPGAGVVGQGGRWSLSENTNRSPHGAGVIGIGGGTGPKVDHLPEHKLNVTGGVGVYGKGADQDIDDTAPNPAPEGGPPVTSGPAAPGNGVLARGGKPNDPTAPAAPGDAGMVAVTAFYAGPGNEEVPPHCRLLGWVHSAPVTSGCTAWPRRRESKGRDWFPALVSKARLPISRAVAAYSSRPVRRRSGSNRLD